MPGIDTLPEYIKPIITITMQEHLSPDIDAIILTGSYVRGDHNEFSDVDIWVFLGRDLNMDEKDYEVYYHEETLVSLCRGKLITWREKLDNPMEFSGMYHAIKDARIIYERDAVFSNLQEEIANYSWERIEQKRKETIRDEIMGFIEELHKVISGMQRADESTMLVGAIGMLLGMSRIMVMHLKLLIRTENEYFARIQESLGMESAWVLAFRELLGLKDLEKHESRQEQICRSALALYVETCNLLELDGKTKKIVDKAIEKANVAMKILGESIR